MVGAVQELVMQGFQDSMRNPTIKVDALATFTLDAPHLTAYDDKIKLRSCAVTVSVEVPPDRLRKLPVQMHAAAVLDDLASSVKGLASLFVARDETLARVLSDWATFKIWNGGPPSEVPLRQNIEYQVQLQEGASQATVRASVDVNGIGPLLRVVAWAEADARRSAEKKQEADKVAAAAQAEIDKLSDSGRWRKKVYIMGFGDRSCSSRGKFCFSGRDDIDRHESTQYEIDVTKVPADQRQIWAELFKTKRPICLINVKKTMDPSVFSFYGWSSFLNNEGELVDCLPGAERSDWDATVAKNKEEAGQTSSGPTAPASTPPPKDLTSPRTDRPQNQPSNLTAVIRRYEPCGSEAICLYTARGNMVKMNVAVLGDPGIAMLGRAAKSQEPLCLKGVLKNQGDYLAEGIASKC